MHVEMQVSIYIDHQLYSTSLHGVNVLIKLYLGSISSAVRICAATQGKIIAEWVDVMIWLTWCCVEEVPVYHVEW